MANRTEQPTRDRIVDASASLFRRQGYAGTGLKAILAASDAPYGSLYHFFPGGKEELGAETLKVSGEFYRELVEHYFAPDFDGAPVDVVAATRAFFEGAAEVLRVTDYADACPIATVALEIASSSERMRVAAADAFESWLAVLRDSLVEAGISSARARELAVEMFCAVEGAFLLSRVTRSTKPVEIAGRAATAAVAAALDLSRGAEPPPGTRRRRRTPG